MSKVCKYLKISTVNKLWLHIRPNNYSYGSPKHSSHGLTDALSSRQTTLESNCSARESMTPARPATPLSRLWCGSTMLLWPGLSEDYRLPGSVVVARGVVMSYGGVWGLRSDENRPMWGHDRAPTTGHASSAHLKHPAPAYRCSEDEQSAFQLGPRARLVETLDAAHSVNPALKSPTRSLVEPSNVGGKDNAITL